MSDHRLEPFAPALAEACDALLGFADPVAARTLVDRMLVSARAWPPSGREALRTAIILVQRTGGMRRRTFAEAMAASERSKLGAVRGASEIVRGALIGAWVAEPAIERALGFDGRCLAPTTPPQMPELEVHVFDRDHRERAEVCIIGSGAAGGILAHDLAALGMSVIVLEAGLAPRRQSGAPLDRVRRGSVDATMRMTSPTPIRLWQGSGVGGSTNAWYGTVARPDAATLQSWAVTMGADDLDEHSMARRFDRVEGLLGAGPIEDALFGENANAVGAGAIRQGLPVIPERRAAPGCGGCGTCMAGCPSGSLATSASMLLPVAQRAGTQIIAQATAERIVVDDGRVSGVEAALRGSDGRRLGTLRVDASIVICAAGAIATPTLLAANALGTRSGTLGRRIAIQPSAFVAGSFDGPLRGWQGVAQTLRIDAGEGVRIQATAFPPGIAATNLPGTGIDLRRRIQAVETIAGILVTALDDDAPGRLGDRGLRYRMSDATAKQLAGGIRAAGDILFAAGAPRVITGAIKPGLVRDPDALAAATDRIDAKTPMRLQATDIVGGCQLGPDPATAVADQIGHVYGTHGLFVVDASILPGPTMAPPMLSVMAFAARVGEFLATNAPKFLS